MTQGVESARVPIGFEDGGEVVAGFPTVGVGVSGELGRSGLELQLVGAKAAEDGQPPETAAVAGVLQELVGNAPSGSGAARLSWRRSAGGAWATRIGWDDYHDLMWRAGMR